MFDPLLDETHTLVRIWIDLEKYSKWDRRWLAFHVKRDKGDSLSVHQGLSSTGIELDKTLLYRHQNGNFFCQFTEVKIRRIYDNHRDLMTLRSCIILDPGGQQL